MNRNLLIALLLGAGALAMLGTRWVIPAAGRKYAALFQKAEYENNLPAFLLAKQAQQESNYNPTARSSAGAIGIMQIVPKWHPGVNPLSVKQSIEYAGRLMRSHFNRFGSWSKALAAYNAGPTRLQREIDAHGNNWLAHMPAETRNYVARITSDVGVA